jgi:hypothetical protein
MIVPAMLTVTDTLWLVGTAIAAAAMVWAVRARRRSHGVHVRTLALQEVCPHLRPALDLLLSRGHQVRRVGQNDPELPLEIHISPRFDPRQIFDELKLAEPVFLSERNVLYCKDDWCEIHPVNG